MYTILVVEDDPINRKAIAVELEKWHYQVMAVPDFNQGLADFIKVAPRSNGNISPRFSFKKSIFRSFDQKSFEKICGFFDLLRS